MAENVFERLESLLSSRNPESVFEFLEEQFREEKKYPHLFETLLMRKRREMGLPLIQIGPLDLQDPQRKDYEENFIRAAREVGALYLADGNVPRAWPYFRAIGETAPVAAAIERNRGDGRYRADRRNCFLRKGPSREGFRAYFKPVRKLPGDQ